MCVFLQCARAPGPWYKRLALFSDEPVLFSFCIAPAYSFVAFWVHLPAQRSTLHSGPVQAVPLPLLQVATQVQRLLQQLATLAAQPLLPQPAVVVVVPLLLRPVARAACPFGSVVQ